MVEFLFGGPNAGLRRMQICVFTNSWRGWFIYGAVVFAGITLGHRSHLGARVAHGSFWESLFAFVISAALIGLVHRITIRLVSEATGIIADYAAWIANSLALGLIVGVYF